MSIPYLLCATILLGVLTRMIYTDTKIRHIETLGLIIFAISLMTLSVMRNGWIEVSVNFVFNIVLLVTMFGSVYSYFRFARGMEPEKYMGLGDVLFIAALAVYFGAREYVWFLVISFTLSLVWWLAIKLFGRMPLTIPLVATTGTCFGFYFIYSDVMLWIS